MALVVGSWGGGNVWRTTAGAFPSNTYFFDEERGGSKAIVIDPGLDGPAIEKDILACGLKPAKVFCTHGHFDHVGSAAYFQQKYGAPVYIHRHDKKTITSSNFLLMLLKIPQKIEQPKVTWVEDGFTIPLGGGVLRYFPVPGHTPGSCIIEFGDVWFTGDTIYARGIGLSDMPGENVELLKKSILSVWGRISNVGLICPGHGQTARGEDIFSCNTSLLRFLGIY
jgi:glyoxylase-like metal-dependent hydrolase (beta-lactamase superfamily II)